MRKQLGEFVWRTEWLWRFDVILTVTAALRWVADQWYLKLMTLEDPQSEIAHLVKADIQWVAHQTVESHDSAFFERAPGAATPCSDYFTHWTHGKRLTLFHILVFSAHLIASSAELTIHWISHTWVRVVWMVSVARLYGLAENWSLYGDFICFIWQLLFLWLILLTGLVCGRLASQVINSWLKTNTSNSM